MPPAPSAGHQTEIQTLRINHVARSITAKNIRIIMRTGWNRPTEMRKLLLGVTLWFRYLYVIFHLCNNLFKQCCNADQRWRTGYVVRRGTRTSSFAASEDAGNVRPTRRAVVHRRGPTRPRTMLEWTCEFRRRGTTSNVRGRSTQERRRKAVVRPRVTSTSLAVSPSLIWWISGYGSV